MHSLKDITIVNIKNAPSLQVLGVADFFHHSKKSFCILLKWKNLKALSLVERTAIVHSSVYCWGRAFKLLHLYFKLRRPNYIWLIAEAEGKNLWCCISVSSQRGICFRESVRNWGLYSMKTILFPPHQGSKKLICLFFSRCCSFFQGASFILQHLLCSWLWKRFPGIYMEKGSSV